MKNNRAAKVDASGAGGGGAPAAAVRNSVSVNMSCQETDLWCWAAVTQAVEDFRGKVVAQADVATGHVSRGQPGATCSSSDPADGTSLCGVPCQGACNSPHILSRVLDERGCLIVARHVTPTFADVVGAIDGGKPLPVRIRIDTGAGGGHFICVVGYSDDGQGNQFVNVLDPLLPGVGQGAAAMQKIPFAGFVGGQYDINGETGTPNFVYDVKV